jgi:arginyl-tRNA synthetase
LAIALSAIKYFFLKVEYIKDMTFNPEEAISFEGDTGPYLQYSYARASSILRKAEKFGETKYKSKLTSRASNKKKPTTKFRIIDLKEQEIKLIKKLAEFPEILEKAKKHFNPSLIANYSFVLAQEFNEFYHTCQVIKSKQADFRLALVQAFRTVIKSSLSLLGIEAMEEM